MNEDCVAEYSVDRFRHGGRDYPIYRAGDGPPVLILHELLGLSDETLRLGRSLVAAGFRVVIPEFLPGKGSKLFMLPNFALICIRRQFKLWARNESGPFLDFARALCQEEAKDSRGIGVIGMCLTGGFALSSVADDDGKLKVPVICEPSLPFGFGASQSALQMSPEMIAQVKQRMRADNVTGIACRFSEDWKSPCQRMERLRSEFGDLLSYHVIDSAEGNANGQNAKAHSVLTENYIDHPGTGTRQVFDDMISLFQRHLC
jgi:dienelactone hydrolase